jgi:primosomal protein N' (replication factor Y)
MNNAKLLMGSATPSVESWHLMEKGILKRLVLRERPAGGRLPDIKIIDLKNEKGIYSAELLKRISAVLAENRQVLVFLNRRGFTHRYTCGSCGEQLSCRHCSVPLTYHKSRGTLVCHYCGFHSPLPSVCPSCGSADMVSSGFGTEKAEEELRRLFPEKIIVRVDTDSVRRKGVLEKTLEDFKNRKTDILLGTQMVAKGLNAPGVKLAVVLNADNSLNLPDFRSAERTFALIMQVAGRAGRFLPDGEVIIQTFSPGNPAVKFAAQNRIEDFYNLELQQRSMLGFPPFSRLFRVVARSRNAASAERAVDNLASLLSGGAENWEILGPSECPIEKIAGNFRYHFLLKTLSFDLTHAALKNALDRFTYPSGVKIEIDIDPVSIL